MAVRTVSSGLNQVVEGIRRKVNTPDLIIELGDALVARLSYYTSGAPGVKPQSGALQDALTFMGAAQQTTSGWSIGVGKKEFLGDSSIASPQGTIAEFLSDYPKYRRKRNNPQKKNAWWDLPKEAKDRLDSDRMTGKYGGIGAQFARYVWAQNDGAVGASIVGRHFIEKAIDEWKQEVPSIVKQYFTYAQTP